MKGVCTCSTCWAWQPKQWDKWRYTDEAAKCGHLSKFTARGDTCDAAAIIKPSTFAARNIAVNLHTDVVPASITDDLEQWYAAHETEFSDVGHRREAKGDDELYPHQKEDVERFKDANEIALFCEQGTGKSATALAIAAHKYRTGAIDSLLIIAPNDVHKQWAVEQLPRWLESGIKREVQCFGGRGGLKETHPFYSTESFHILVTNIDTFSTPEKWKDIVRWALSRKCMIILDEATCAKNVKAKRTERLLYEFNEVRRRGRSILSSVPRTVARAILTGTPITNGITDIWSLMEFLRPNYFGRNWHSFRNHYAMLATITTAYGATQVAISQDLWDGIKGCSSFEAANVAFGVSLDTYETVQMQTTYQGAYKHEDELKELIAPVSVFRLLKDCVDMPEQVYNRKLVTMNAEQQKAYKTMEAELIAQHDGATMTAANKLSALVRLGQISSGFIVQGQQAGYDADAAETWWACDYDVEPGEVVWLGTSVPKMEQLYRDIEESAKPCIVICRFSAEASRIYDDLSKIYKTLLYTGWKKTGDVEDFKTGKYDVLVANIRVISRGFNLQNASHMFFYSNTFSLEDRLQTEGRTFRIGQKNTTVYTDYANIDSVDIRVIGALRQKRKLLDYVRGTGMDALLNGEDEITMMEGAA
jgi:SNF2 family DNA or RNA helicase